DLEHVIAAPAINEIALCVFELLVAGAGPFAEEGRARLLSVVPVHDRAGGPAHLQFAHFALRFDDVAIVVDEPHVIAGHRLAGGAVFHLAGAVGDENVQHLGRADAVENVDTETLAEAAADIRRQRLAGRDAAADFYLAGSWRGGARQ